MSASGDDQPTGSVTGDDDADDATATEIGPEDVGTAPAPSEAGTDSVYAWSLDVGEESGVKGAWRGRLVWVGLVALLSATAAAFVWFGAVLYREHRTAPGGASSAVATSATPGTPTSQPPPLSQAPPLDGTYRRDVDGRRDTVNGRPDPSSGGEMWVGFRSACSQTLCVATSAVLDPHNLRAPNNDPTFVFHWVGETWQGNIVFADYCSGPYGEAHEETSMAWVLTPGADGSYSGTSTTRITSDTCGNMGDVYESFFTLTRTGPAPPDVIADPPLESAATQTWTALAQPTITNPPASARVIFDSREMVTSGLPTCIWVDRKLNITISGPGNLSLVDAVMTATRVESVGFTVNDEPFFFQDGVSNGATASVTQRDKKSYTITGLVAGPDPSDPGSLLTPSFTIDVTCR